MVASTGCWESSNAEQTVSVKYLSGATIKDKVDFLKPNVFKHPISWPHMLAKIMFETWALRLLKTNAAELTQNFWRRIKIHENNYVLFGYEMWQRRYCKESIRVT